MRDARSLLMLKLLLLTRRGADLEPLLSAQRAHFATLAERLAGAAEEAAGVAAVELAVSHLGDVEDHRPRARR